MCRRLWNASSVTRFPTRCCRRDPVLEPQSPTPFNRGGARVANPFTRIPSVLRADRSLLSFFPCSPGCDPAKPRTCKNEPPPASDPLIHRPCAGRHAPGWPHAVRVPANQSWRSASPRATISLTLGNRPADLTPRRTPAAPRGWYVRYHKGGKFRGDPLAGERKMNSSPTTRQIRGGVSFRPYLLDVGPAVQGSAPSRRT